MWTAFKQIVFYSPDKATKLKQSIVDLEKEFTKRKIEFDTITQLTDLSQISNAVIWVFGGDGTLHTLVNQIKLNTNFVVMMGGGSGNDFLKNFKKETLTEYFNKLENVSFNAVDLWNCNGIKFINAGSVGFSATVAESANNGKVKSGFLKYAIPVMQHLLFHKALEVTLQLGTALESKKIFLLGFGNGAFVGGGFNLFKGAVLNDSKLNLLSISKPTVLQKILYVLKAKKGKHLNLSVCKYQKVSALQIESKEGLKYELDGEVYEANSMRIVLHNECLKVLNSLA